jgi:GDP-L-fucose synthase
MNEKRLLFGKNSFIGKNLSADIKLSKSDCNLLDFDQTFSILSELKPDQIINCAANHGSVQAMSKNHTSFFVENIVMNINLLKATHQLGIDNVLLLGSISSFPINTKETFTEDDYYLGPVHVRNFGYNSSKRVIVDLVEAYRLDYGRNYKVAHLGNIYGPHMRFGPSETLVGNLVYQIVDADRANRDVELYGDGTDVRSLTYVGDLVRLLPKYLQNKKIKSGIIFSSGFEISVSELAHKIGEKLNHKQEIRFTGHSALGIKKVARSNRIESVDDTHVFTPIDEGVALTIDWYLNHKNAALAQ